MSRFKLHRPSPALAVSLVALFVALGGSAVAATTILIHTKNIANGAVTNHKLANGAVGLAKLNTQVRSALTSAGKGRGIVTGSTGATGSAGAAGSNGTNGTNGTNGLNPGTAVINVPTIANSSGNNPNADSGDAGDGGFYFSGDGSGGSASLAGGELILTGVGVDNQTEQGGIGIAKAYNNVPLTKLDGVSYGYHVGTSSSNNTPLVHVTVTGLCGDSKFNNGTAPSCFANLVYSPALNGVTVNAGADYTADAFLPSAKWYSTTEGANGVSNINAPGGQNDSQPLSFFTGKSTNNGAAITQISLDNGGSSSATGSFEAAADDLVVGLSGTNTRYDFGG